MGSIENKGNKQANKWCQHGPSVSMHRKLFGSNNYSNIIVHICIMFIKLTCILGVSGIYFIVLRLQKVWENPSKI